MVIIERGKCSLCRACVEICPASCVSVVAEELFISSSSFCGACRQCIARCPQGALSWTGTAPRRIDRRLFPSPENLDELFAAHRSIRKFRDSAPDAGLVNRIVKTAGIAPTDITDLEMILVTHPKTLRALESLALDRIERIYLRFYERPWLYDIVRRFSFGVNEFERIRLRCVLKHGSLFYGAPALILSAADPRMPGAEASCHYALDKMMLMAETLGLGTCLSGTAQSALAGIRQVGKLLGVSNPKKILGVLLLGYPDVEFPRAAGRDAMPVRRA